jgi:hypothetical protein
MIKCKLCPFEGYELITHLQEVHSLTTYDYVHRHRGPTISEEIWEQLASESLARKAVTENTTVFSLFGMSKPINFDVPEEVCLPLPSHYRYPRSGKLCKDLKHILVSLLSYRSIYIWGLSGTGKDAFIHAYCHDTRTPSEIFAIRPGEDINHWLFIRGISEQGTYWEEGHLLKCLRENNPIPYPYI